MKTIAYINHQNDIEKLAHAKITEGLFTFKDFSRIGKLDLRLASELIFQAKNAHIKPILDWDILMTENVMKQVTEKLKDFPLNQFSAVRVQDPGALYYLTQNYPAIDIHLNLETGNHNLESILAWVDVAPGQIKRVILSLELPSEKLKTYTSALKEKGIETEFLLFGRILLFYTPRSLLKPLFFDHEDQSMKDIYREHIELLGSSEESPHKGFPVVESMHGTFMYHIKDHWLMEQIPQLLEMGLAVLRLDSRHTPTFDLSSVVKLIKDFNLDEAKRLKEIYPHDVMRGFFHVNKTDVLFKKLKNGKIVRNDELYLGEVLESNKEGYLVFINKSKRVVNRCERVVVINPEGKKFELTLKNLKDLSLKDRTQINQGELAIIGYHSGVVSKSQIYYVQ